MRAALGVDPDLTSVGWAIVVEDSGGHQRLARVGCARSSRRRPMPAIVEVGLVFREAMRDALDVPELDLVVVESQKIYLYTKSRHEDIMHLGQAAGTLLGTLITLLGEQVQYLFPDPHAWKGSIPKRVHQARVLSRLGIPYEKVSDYCVPTEYGMISGGPDVKRADWKHVVDAIGLACWALNEGGSSRSALPRENPPAAPSGHRALAR